MTGQPADQNERQNDKQKMNGWDAQTRALAARLEALLEQDRAQGPEAANDGSRDGGAGRPGS